MLQLPVPGQEFVEFAGAMVSNAGVENYFSRVSGAQIVAALCEAKGVPAAPSWSKMKKTELAVLAAREIVGTGWLPEAMRLRNNTVEDLDQIP